MACWKRERDSSSKHFPMFSSIISSSKEEKFLFCFCFVFLKEKAPNIESPKLHCVLEVLKITHSVNKDPVNVFDLNIFFYTVKTHI